MVPFFYLFARLSLSLSLSISLSLSVSLSLLLFFQGHLKVCEQDIGAAFASFYFGLEL